MSSNPNYAIGHMLRYARHERRLSVAQAAHALHIRARYLEALEEGALSELPGLAYTRGYLQSYAAFLGLDKDEILRQFEGMESGLARKGFYLPEVFSKEKNPPPWAIWGGLAAAFAFYLIWLVFLRPSLVPLSLIEPMPLGFSGKAPLSAETPEKVACLRPRTALYPPCIWRKEPGMDLFHLPGPMFTGRPEGHP